MFNIKIDRINKVIISVGEGCIEYDDAVVFLKNLYETINSINPEEYTLIIDTSKSKPVPSDIVPMMKESMDICLTTPFKKMFSVVLESTLLKMQAKKANRQFVQRMTFVKSIDEALKLIWKLQ